MTKPKELQDLEAEADLAREALQGMGPNSVLYAPLTEELEKIEHKLEELRRDYYEGDLDG
jgi:hypothetical protein